MSIAEMGGDESMDLGVVYLEHGLVDTDFYDSLQGWDDLATRFALAGEQPPAGWGKYQEQLWVSFAPHGVLPPEQGWKVHVPATLANAEHLLSVVAEHCLRSGLTFKFLRSRQALQLANSKYADRAASGKFCVLYPSEDELEHSVTELGAALDGQSGPYILSDLRWKSGPVYQHYGAFQTQYCLNDAGEPVFALTDPTAAWCPTIAGRCSDCPSGSPSRRSSPTRSPTARPVSSPTRCGGGEPLTRCVGERYPLVAPDPDAQEIAEYTGWAVQIVKQLGDALHVLHERGVVLGDVQPSNVIVRPGRPHRLVDLELALPVDGGGRPALGAPGFSAPPGCTGVAVDEHGLASLALWLFWHSAPVLCARDPSKVELFLTELTRRFGVTESFAADIRQGLHHKPLHAADPAWTDHRRRPTSETSAGGTFQYGEVTHAAGR